MPTIDGNETELAKGFTVGDYRAAVSHKNKSAIVQAIQQRFTQRYVEPASIKDVHGFTKMAVACLMIEALQSFRDGLANTKDRSKATVIKFLKTSGGFKEFDTLEKDFYFNIRCGILHQAEATDGWRIRRTGPLFDPATRTINATRFLNTLSDELKGYCDQLTNAEWNSSEWQNVRKKMDAICNNCQSAQTRFVVRG